MPKHKDPAPIAASIKAKYPLSTPECLDIVQIVLDALKPAARMRDPDQLAVRDADILRLAWEKVPYHVIARRVGLTTASSIAKRMAAMRKRGELVPDAPRGTAAAVRPLAAQVVPLLRGGYLYSEIAKRLHVSVEDVKQAELELKRGGVAELPDQEDVESWRIRVEDADHQFQLAREVMEELGDHEPDNSQHRYALECYNQARKRRADARSPSQIPKYVVASPRGL